MRLFMIGAAVLVSLLAACGGNNDEADIRQALEGYVSAINQDDIPALYDFFSEECKELVSLEEFADLTFLGENEVKLTDVQIIELMDDEAIIELEIALISDGEEVEIEGEDGEPDRGTMVKEGGRWRITECENFGAEPEDDSNEEPRDEVPAEEIPPETAADIREAMQGYVEAYFEAVLDPTQQADFSEAYTFLSDACNEESSLVLFEPFAAEGPALGEVTFTLKDLRFLELTDDTAVIEPEFVRTLASGEEPVALDVEDGLVELIKEDGQWRLSSCAEPGAEHGGEFSDVPPEPFSDDDGGVSAEDVSAGEAFVVLEEQVPALRAQLDTLNSDVNNVAAEDFLDPDWVGVCCESTFQSVEGVLTALEDAVNELRGFYERRNFPESVTATFETMADELASERATLDGLPDIRDRERAAEMLAAGIAAPDLLGNTACEFGIVCDGVGRLA